MKTTKSPRKVLETAYGCAKGSLPRFSHFYSPKKFTQHQLFACLALKEFMKLDYRGLMQLLIDTPDLCRVIELGAVPHWTTFQKATDRLLKKTPPTPSSTSRSRSPNRPAFIVAARG